MDSITTPSRIKEYIRKSSFYFKKNLGQNFLIDENITRKITDLLETYKNDIIVEIGPGFGSLTQFIIPEALSTYAIEIDPFAVKVLGEIFEGEESLHLINTDFLKADIPALIADEMTGSALVKAISNIPYYITSPIILKLLCEKPDYERIVIMVQKEVADRITAPVGTKDYSAFSITIDYFAEVHNCFDVSRDCFMPQPNVDSTVLVLTPRKEKKVQVDNEEVFLKTVRSAFAMRRKTMLNCIAAGFSMSKDDSRDILEKAGISPQIRGEKLDIYEFAHLSNVINAKK